MRCRQADVAVGRTVALYMSTFNSRHAPTYDSKEAYTSSILPAQVPGRVIRIVASVEADTVGPSSPRDFFQNRKRLAPNSLRAVKEQGRKGVRTSNNTGNFRGSRGKAPGHGYRQ